MRIIFLWIIIFSIVTGCNNNNTITKASANIDSPQNKADVLRVNMDTAVNPSDDFFMYANGGWIKSNPIPPDQGSWSIGNLVIEENLKRLRSISEKAAATKSAHGSTEQKIGDYWSTAMDSAKIEQLGLQPLKPYFDKINAINDIKSLVATVADLKKIGSSTLFNDYVAQDDKNSEVMSYKLVQGGIGLPEREYYFKTDSATSNIRSQYVNYITRTLIMAGEDGTKATADAKSILSLETKLAKASRKIEDLRDPYANYNKMAIAELPKMSSNIDWSLFLNNTGIKGIDSVIVGQPEFFKALNNILTGTPLDVWKSDLKFNLISDFSGALPEQYGIESFNFTRLFTGAKERRPRWKRVIQSEEASMGELLGQLYVKEFFSETAKKRYSDMVESIRDALKDRIGKLTWMTDSTKQKAYVKLAAMKKKVGYPDKWKDFSSMDIGHESYLQNLVNAHIWWHNYNMNKLGKPVDRDEWDMTPQTYNAYYNPSNNEIVLPAGIFTVPNYRDEQLDDATVYGYAGASTIGHEITHGFDDEGRQFDEKGNLKSWWTKKDEEEFKKRADVMVRQFNEYEPVKGYHINGKATLGENIADLGGILLGIEAFKKTEQYKKGEKIQGLDPMQRYFLGYALGWLGQIREEQLRNRLLTDVHSPAKYRVNGPFVDVDEFYTTFPIQPNTPMYRPDSLRVRIW
ncbi:M13 family metallopeptidase [Flavisolibacter ginsengisoli]|jgi:putative endopeptidase|uniref:Putative endopeptidase n=1 Tax=Flavisolibacter ginsengisoli DSM 18119 TaxID=1121884 RepID=A0A1M4X3Y7_9BACT|nr:M13 family metallopeptidase [Flavisolibacter ginsengisoli]SHE88169.1 putative endopeptidase [Flavisolibacter ginsengisoli DSM 18119]